MPRANELSLPANGRTSSKDPDHAHLRLRESACAVEKDRGHRTQRVRHARGDWPILAAESESEPCGDSRAPDRRHGPLRARRPPRLPASPRRGSQPPAPGAGPGTCRGVPRQASLGRHPEMQPVPVCQQHLGQGLLAPHRLECPLRPAPGPEKHRKLLRLQPDKLLKTLAYCEGSALRLQVSVWNIVQRWSLSTGCI